LNKKIINLTKKALEKSRALKIYGSITGRKHVILGFHRICSNGLPVNSFDTCPTIELKLFREILIYVKQHYNILPLSEFYKIRDLDKPLAAITFDDGWRDNYDLAFPVLQGLKVPATIFVTTGKIGTDEPFWQQMLGKTFKEFMGMGKSREQENFKKLLGIEEKVVLTQDFLEKTTHQWKSLSSADLKEKVDLLRNYCKDFRGTRCFLNIEEIQEMLRFGIEFGTHSINHLILSKEPDAIVETELSGSKKTLEKVVGKLVDMLAYPDGGLNDRVVEIARDLGYKVGCTTKAGYACKRDDPMRLPRLGYPLEFTSR